MILSEYIEALTDLSKAHGGDLPVVCKILVSAGFDGDVDLEAVEAKPPVVEGVTLGFKTMTAACIDAIMDDALSSVPDREKEKFAFGHEEAYRRASKRRQ